MPLREGDPALAGFLCAGPRHGLQPTPHRLVHPPVAIRKTQRQQVGAAPVVCRRAVRVDLRPFRFHSPDRCSGRCMAGRTSTRASSRRWLLFSTHGESYFPRLTRAEANEFRAGKLVERFRGGGLEPVLDLPPAGVFAPDDARLESDRDRSRGCDGQSASGSRHPAETPSGGTTTEVEFNACGEPLHLRSALP